MRFDKQLFDEVHGLCVGLIMGYFFSENVYSLISWVFTYLVIYWIANKITAKIRNIKTKRGKK